MKKTMDVVTIGETLVVFVPNSVGPLRFAGKFERTIGGAESNVAIALSRLGHQAGWISRLGQDEFGIYLKNYVRGEGVDISQVTFDEHYPTGVLFKERQMAQDPKVFFYRKGSAASQISPLDLNEEYISQAKFLHITGILPALSGSCKETVYRAIEIAKKHQLTIVFDPNIRLKLLSKEEAREVLLDIASQCDIVLPGLEEGQILTGESHPELIAKRLMQNGAKVVVIKLGEHGAYYATAEETGYVAGFQVKQIIDTVAAGDGFAAGFLCGLLRGFSYAEAVRIGNRVGSLALTVAGDIEAYPFWSQVDPSKESKEILR